MLSEELHTSVRISNLRIGLFNRIVMDDVDILDQQNRHLLSATRLSATIDPWQLLSGHIRVANIQLFGYRIRLRRHSPDQPYNFQFILDKFASNDTTETALDLSVNSIVIRRGSISHHLDYVPSSTSFTPAHMQLNDVNIRATIDHIYKDDISVELSHLSLKELISGLNISELKGQFSSKDQDTKMSQVTLALQDSELYFEELTFHGSLSDFSTADGAFNLVGELTLHDLSPFVPQLSNLHTRLQLQATAEKHGPQIHLKEFSASANELMVLLSATGQLNLEDTTLTLPLDHADIELHRLYVKEAFMQTLASTFSQPTASGASPLLQPSVAEMIARLGELQMTGEVKGTVHPRQMDADVHVLTSLGSVSAKGEITNDNQFNLHAETSEFLLGELLTEENSIGIDEFTLTTDINGFLKQKTAQGNLLVTDLKAFGTQLNQIEADLDLSQRTLKADVTLTDDEYNLHFITDLQSSQNITWDAKTIDDLQGTAALKDLHIRNKGKDYRLNQLQLAGNNDHNGHHLLVRGDFIDAHIDGKFQYAQLIPTCQQYLHKALPSLVSAPAIDDVPSTNQMHFSMQFWNATSLLELAGIDLHLPQPGYIEGHLDDAHARMSLAADFPHLLTGSEDLRSASLLFRQEHDSLSSFVQLQRMMDEGPVDFSISANGHEDWLTSTLTWDDHNHPAQRGEIKARTHFYAHQEQKFSADIQILPSQMMVSDTIWNIHPSQIYLHGKALDVHGFQVSQEGRHLKIDGRVSEHPVDTLYADLRGINLQYVFNLIDFHDVELEGSATGRMKIHDIYQDVTVDAKLEVNDFTINEGLLGKTWVTGGFGRKGERAIDLDALIQEPEHQKISHVTALIKPGHAPGRGIDLEVQAQHLNTYFINSFTKGVFTDLQGCASGYAHLHGPFKALDLEGQLALDTMSLSLDVLNTRYHLSGGDTIVLHPGGIRFKNLHVYDSYHGQDQRRHDAFLNGELRYKHFSNLHYDFDITAYDFLGYDFHSFGDQLFYGTVFADGTVHISGSPDALNIDIQCTPTNGTVFTYNASSPETVTDNAFISFVDSRPTATDANMNSLSSTSLPDREGQGGESEPMDIRMNFNLDITPDAQMRLLMDARTGDYITLYGDGHIRATFFNKGRFQMYGTYHVDHGTYKLSLQDVIRKEFRFQQGGTVVFGGNPMQGALNMQAVYTVPSVSLNDLAAGTNFSNTNVRVNCLMNITGQVEQPQITFDFDIPNVNEDEKQMVRSLISTDEERNMQVIYLLGIGRFYTYGLDTGQSQTNAAMSSLLSSTLSGQLNELLSNVIGNGNWNFGTNLSTGNRGWNEVDVEGMLSGRLLNNRLLINGTFGYRDTPLANTNFIGDFDVQWLLTPSGNISLKAYSETNDRYFTKTALTTQGVGIQVKKDFNNLRELFRPNKAKK